MIGVQLYWHLHLHRTGVLLRLLVSTTSTTSGAVGSSVVLHRIEYNYRHGFVVYHFGFVRTSPIKVDFVREGPHQTLRLGVRELSDRLVPVLHQYQLY